VQLDKTAITISQRSGIEVIDLSLLVVRRYWQSIAFFAFVGILPFAIADFVLLWPITQYESLLIASRDFTDVGVYHFRYLCTVAAIIMIQAPIALSPVTYFIGQAVFIEQPSARQVFSAVLKRFGAIILILGILRLSLVVFVPAVFLFLDPSLKLEVEIPLYLFCLCGLAFCIRGFRPFAAEILLLERCPIRKPKNRQDQLAYGQRSKWLHSSLDLQLFGSHMGITIVEILTALSISLSLVFLIGVLTGNWSWGIWMDLFLFPLSIWLVAIWATVIRFLFYMNSRIRTEGWEIELRLKAEAQRLQEVPTW
jgi:hypothetical protein